MGNLNAVTPKRRGPLLAALMVGALIVAVVVVVLTRDRDSEAAPPPSTKTSAVPSAAPEPAFGCLGGTANMDQVALRAQAQAPITPEGAAGVLASFVRWMNQARMFPEILESEGDKLWSARLADAELQEFKDALLSDKSQGALATVSLKDAVYRVLEWTPQSAVVETTAYMERDGEGAQYVILARLDEVSGHWRFGGLQSELLASRVGDDDENGEAYMADLEKVGIPYKDAC